MMVVIAGRGSTVAWQTNHMTHCKQCHAGADLDRVDRVRNPVSVFKSNKLQGLTPEKNW